MVNKTLIGIASLIVAIGIIGAVFTYLQKKEGDLEKYKIEQAGKSFDNNEQKHDVVDLLDIEFHPLTLAKTQDVLNGQLKEVDSLISNTLKQKIKDAEYKRVQDSIENIRAVEVQKLRVKKYKLQAKILDELILIKDAQRKMNIRLDSLK